MKHLIIFFRGLNTKNKEILAVIVIILLSFLLTLLDEVLNII
jgi:hypothetical protein